MAEERFLVVRLSSLGDIAHTVPAVAALRESFPEARIDWLVEHKWAPLLAGSAALNEVIPLDRASWRGVQACVQQLRAARYTCAIDFQGLYKSAVLAWLSGAPRRVGLDRRFAREAGAALFYTECAVPSGLHAVERHLAIAERAGARATPGKFPFCVPERAEANVARRLAESGLQDFYVLSPAGSWRKKCWPPERFGELYRELETRHGWRGVVNYGPGEEGVAEAVCRAAAPARLVLFPTDLPELPALLRRARFLVGADTGPLHLAVALGTPVVGVYGPTDPERNGPYCTGDVVVRNARPEETSYKRSNEYSPTMLSIKVPQVVAAIEKRMGIA